MSFRLPAKNLEKGSDDVFGDFLYSSLLDAVHESLTINPTIDPFIYA